MVRFVTYESNWVSPKELAADDAPDAKKDNRSTRLSDVRDTSFVEPRVCD